MHLKTKEFFITEFLDYFFQICPLLRHRSDLSDTVESDLLKNLPEVRVFRAYFILKH